MRLVMDSHPPQERKGANADNMRGAPVRIGLSEAQLGRYAPFPIWVHAKSDHLFIAAMMSIRWIWLGRKLQSELLEFARIKYGQYPSYPPWMCSIVFVIGNRACLAQKLPSLFERRFG